MDHAQPMAAPVGQLAARVGTKRHPARTHGVFLGGVRVIRDLAYIRDARQVQVGVVGHHIVGPAPPVPVEPRGNRLRGKIALVRAGIVVTDDRLDLANPSVADQFDGLPRGGVGSLHLAGLEHPLVLANRLDHHPPLADRVAQRLLAVHVLSGLAGMDAGKVMPMLRSGVDDDFHVLAVQQCAVVLVRLGPIVRAPTRRRVSC